MDTIKNKIVKFYVEHQYGKPVMFLLLTVIISSILSEHFLTLRNFESILITASPLIVLGVGVSLVVLTGMIDLGIEAVAASAGVIIAILDLSFRLPTGLSIAIVILYGMLVGALVGLLVVKFGIPSFIVTLGTYWGLRGVGMLISGGSPITASSYTPYHPISYSWLAGYFYDIPVMPVIAIAIGLFVHYYVSQSQRGRHLYAIGGHEKAAGIRGVDVDKNKIFVFIGSGMFAAFAGILLSAYVSQGYAWAARGYSLQAIAAVVLGGIPFTGGHGTVLGVMIGAIIIAIISDIITLLGISPLYNYIVVAVVLILAGLQINTQEVVK